MAIIELINSHLLQARYFRVKPMWFSTFSFWNQNLKCKSNWKRLLIIQMKSKTKKMLFLKTNRHQTMMNKCLNQLIQLNLKQSQTKQNFLIICSLSSHHIILQKNSTLYSQDTFQSWLIVYSTITKRNFIPIYTILLA